MKYGLIGKTLIHSYSKEIHEALGKYEYDLFSLSADELPGFITARDFGGLNVTIPYKQDVMALCDEVSALAAEIRAVNTLYWRRHNSENGNDLDDDREHNILVGHNTDYEGFIYAAERAEIAFARKNILILGSGGTSLMIRKAAADMGAARIYTASRTGANVPTNAGLNTSENTAITRCSGSDVGGSSDIDLGSGSARAAVSMISYNDLTAIAESIDIVVNATPVGTYPDTMSSIISLEDFPNCRAVIDVIYNPFKTALLLQAEKLGLRFSNGLPMLVAQATAAAGYFLGIPGAFCSENERIISEMEKRMQNIVLIGMPGCGKSTIGRLLAEKIDKSFVDMDEEIIKDAGMSIPEIFAKEGEHGFRERETNVAAALGKKHGQVIATGGGAVLRQQNVDALKQNGFLIHILRPAEKLPTDGRPLSADLSALKEMAEKRLPVYEAAADMTFDNTKTLNEEELLNAFLSKL